MVVSLFPGVNIGSCCIPLALSAVDMAEKREKRKEVGEI